MKTKLNKVAILFFLLILSSCSPNIRYYDNQVAVMRNYPASEDGRWHMTIFITNGFTDSTYIENVELWFTTLDDLTIARQTYNVDEVLEPRSYIKMELEFDEEHTFYTEEEMNELGGFHFDNEDSVKLDNNITYELLK